VRDHALDPFLGCWAKPTVGGRKVFLPTNEIYVGLGGLDQNSTMGLKHGPKAISEDLKSLPFFMPWA